MDTNAKSNGETEKKAPKSKSEPSIQSINRAIQILHCFSDNARLTLTEICQEVGLHKSTVYGIVTTLKNNDFLEKDEETGVYRLGVGLYKLASHVNVDLRTISIPLVHELCSETGETVNLVVPDENYIIYIEKCESRHSMRISTSIGTRLPMYCTAVGKAIMAFLPDPDAVSHILDQTRLTAVTRNTLTSKDAILQELGEIRQRGYAIDREELEYGLVCIAAPIMNAIGEPIAAISCSGPLQRMTEGNISRISEEVTRCALKISSKIPY